MPSDCDENSPLAHVTKAELQEWQEQDPTLRQAWEVAYPKEGDLKGKNGSGSCTKMACSTADGG